MSNPTEGRPPTAGAAAALSALFPGLGQWWSGRRRRAVLWALPAAGALAVVLTVAFTVHRDGPVALLRILVQPRWLWALLALNALLAVERVAAIGDAWWLRRRSPGGWGLRITALLVATVMLVPHVIVHVYVAEALDLVGTVFADQQVPSLAEREAELIGQGYSEEDLGPTTTTTLAPTTTTTVGAATTTLIPTTTLAPISHGVLGDRYTVLLAGGDFGPGRKDLRTDVMIVASLDLVSGRASLIGVSRDLVNAPLPASWGDADTMHRVQIWHEDQEYKKIVAEAKANGEDPPEQVRAPFCDCFYDRLNYLHVLTTAWVRTFPDAPDPGMETLRQTLELLLGIPIDAYVLVDFAGFVDLVDALGGVTVTVTESLHETLSPAKEGEDPISIDVDPGVHLLDGHEALAYVRDRTGSSDGERMRRQRCMIRELAAAADTTTLVRNFPAIAAAIRNSTTTTLPVEYLPAIIDVLGGLEAGDIATLAIGAQYSTERNYLNLPIIEPDRVRRAVANLLSGVAAGTTLGSADECG